MNAPKNPTDLAPSTFARQRASDTLPWSKLYGETVLLVYGAAISDRAKLTFIRLQPMLKRSEEEGYLVEDGKPIALRTLARQIGKTEKALTNEIEELIDVRLLKKDGKKICDPWMVADKKATDFLKSRGQLSYNNDGSNLEEKSEVSVSQGVASQNGQSNNGSNYHTVEESRTENTRFSASTAAKAARETTPAPGGAVVSLAGGISDAEIAKLKRDPKYAGKDVDEVMRKCGEYCAAKGEPMTLKRLRGWLKRERTTTTGTPEPREAGNPYTGSIADLYDYLHRDWSSIKKMPPEKRDGDAAEWLHIKIGVEGDMQGCLEDLAAGGDILDYFLPDEFESSDKGAEMLLAGCDWIGRMDENHNTRLKGSKWLVSKPAKPEQEPTPAEPEPAAHKSQKHLFTAARQPADGLDEDEEGYRDEAA